MGDAFYLLTTSYGLMGVIILLFFAILLFFVVVFLTLPTGKKINKRTGKLIDKGIATEKNVKISAILSIIFPGLGQIYNREAPRGVLYIMLGLLYIIIIGSSGIIALITSDIGGSDSRVYMMKFSWEAFGYSVAMMIISGLIYVIIAITCSIDAYRMAMNINRSITENEESACKH